MNALLEQFLLESREALQAIGSTLLAMEREPDDAAQLAELFRLVHTLKGNSGLFDFPALTSVLHAAEDVMVALRNQQLDFNPQLADELLEAADYVGQFVDEVEWHSAPGPDFQLAPLELVRKLRAWLSSEVVEDVALAASAGSACAAIVLPAAAQQVVLDALAAGQSLFYVQYQPSADSFFQGTDPLHLLQQLERVLWRRISPLAPWPALAELDAYTCNLQVQAVVVSAEAELLELFRYIAEQVSWQALDASSCVASSAPVAELEPAAVTDLSPLALEIVRTQQAILQACVAQPWPSGQQQAAVQTLVNVFTSEAHGHLLESLALHSTQAAADGQAGVLLTWLEQLVHQATAQQLAQVSASAELAPVVNQPVADWLSSMLVTAPPEAALATAAPLNEAPAQARKLEDSALAPAKVLKVEQEKIDRLMNLIGEIVVAKNGLPYLAQRAEEDYAQRELAREIKLQFGVINRIAEDLQDAIMQVRMMPVSFVLQRFPRLVRDIARKLGKKVNLLVEGDETEADKAMIEALADPLVHVVRNALDHGLEEPAERLAQGKPEVGTLRIVASQSGDHVSIVISDDGRGIDAQKIKAKVLAKQLLSIDVLEHMSEQELINLVFLPGFSTAETISDLSGRGVGMDVVRSAIEKVGGHLQLTSVKAQGTQLRLSLPLSMAVTQVMVIESAGQKYGVPMDQVMETVRLPASAIHTVKHQPMALLRGRALPLSSLNQLLAVGQAQRLNEDQEHALMVLRHQGEQLGLLIDDFHGSMDIILKPMVGIIGELPGYAGTAVMGNGSILMILNPMELIA